MIELLPNPEKTNFNLFNYKPNPNTHGFLITFWMDYVEDENKKESSLQGLKCSARRIFKRSDPESNLFAVIVVKVEGTYRTI